MMNRQMADPAFRSSVMQQQPVPWHRQRGSLPLKKRRFLDFNDDLPPQPRWESSMDMSSKLEPFTAPNPLLALVAAASVSSEPSLFSSHVDYQQPPPHSSSTISHSHNIIHDEGPTNGIITAALEQPEETISSNNKSRQRVHHPPLSNPLPGGCHGRTSRNNSYCRRHPCYNGSKYCKLHYQQYIVAGRSDGETTSSSVLVETEQPQQQSRAAPSTTSSSQQQHQDKRFTGFGNEVRCDATTTRGRACAYVSVNNTSYCYLHADYETNPPPRRGGLVGPKPKQEEGSSSSLMPLLQTIPEKSTSSPPSVTSEESCATFSSNISSGAVAETPGNNNNKHPLLSSIASDQWFDKLVLISTGPLINHTGRVVKWGNGWVTVRTSSTGSKVDGLLHNRRSVELFLLPQDKHEEDVPQEQEKSELSRCVSLETDGDVAREASSGNEDSSNETYAPVVETDGMRYTTPSKEEPTVIPQRSHEESLDTTPCQEKNRPAQSETSSVKEGHASSTGPHQVTPTPRKKVSRAPPEDGIPLVDCLLAAQEGRRKYNLDLLFGTAALERSRRTVHKPTRYEDTAMLERKRQRLNGDTSDTDSLAKRKRMDSPKSPKKLCHR